LLLLLLFVFGLEDNNRTSRFLSVHLNHFLSCFLVYWGVAIFSVSFVVHAVPRVLAEFATAALQRVAVS